MTLSLQRSFFHSGVYIFSYGCLNRSRKLEKTHSLFYPLGKSTKWRISYQYADKHCCQNFKPERLTLLFWGMPTSEVKQDDTFSFNQPYYLFLSLSLLSGSLRNIEARNTRTSQIISTRTCVIHFYNIFSFLWETKTWNDQSWSPEYWGCQRTTLKFNFFPLNF